MIQREFHLILLSRSIAEFKGPGVHHGGLQDSEDDYDMDLDQRTRMLGGRAGRIILLGDGTEVLTDSADNDSEMFEQSEDDEEQDLESQVQKGQAQAEREETPGPSSSSNIEDGGGENATSQQKAAKSASEGTGPGSTPDEPKMMAATDSLSSGQMKDKLNQ